METETVKNADALKALNERLGITDRDSMFDSHELQSVDELLENSRKEFERFSKEISEKKRDVESAEMEMENAVSEYHNGNETSLPQTLDSINNFESTIRVMEGLVSTGESIMQRLYDAIGQTDLVDPDVIEATAKIIESVRISLSDIINYHNTKFQREFDYKKQFEMENLKQNNKIALEVKKSELRMKEAEHKQKLKEEAELAKAQNAVGGEIGATSQNSSEWNQTQMMEMMRKILNSSDTDADNTK